MDDWLPASGRTPGRTRGRRAAADRTAAAAAWMCAVVVTLAFGWIAADLLWHGLSRLTPGFLFEMPQLSGRAGGLASIIVSTLAILAICLAAAVPIGLGTAILLAEYSRSDRRLGRFVRRSLDVLAGVPSIVFGLFGNAFFCVYLGMGFSLLAGGLTLACMVLPLLIRSLEQGLREVPDDWRNAAAALGMSKAATLRSILLPAALPGLVVGLVLGMGRALAETAALLFTSGYVMRMPGSVMDSGRALSIHIFDLSMNVPGGTGNAYGAAVVLLLMLLTVNLLALGIARRWQLTQPAPL